MILVCGGLADLVIELVCARIEACGYPYRLLDLGFYPQGYSVSWQWEGLYPTGYISSEQWRLGLEEISGLFIRYPSPKQTARREDLPSELSDSVHMECNLQLSVLVEHLPCLVANRLAGGTSNHSKTYQALHVRSCGLKTPSTLVTTDPEAALRFYEEHAGEVIYKSLSGIRSIVRRLVPDELQRLQLLRHGPAQFQEFIPGVNVRVHTVGGELFATMVHSEAVDYRFAEVEGEHVYMEPFSLPPDIAEACLRLAGRLDLLIAGIDFKLTPEGEYYCFEINPAPAFSYYEQHTGQPISEALANVLHRGVIAA
jgi:glutathione synthase/RimK-type ligase-like ATP-grasp enzyme